ncbi:MAG TPA: glycosyltransferase family 2 protein [Pyrinomonadaceae bacterium]|nr:glycosyltransferase family 2 protein [Pyrinomonadaceae bacterium]
MGAPFLLWGGLILILGLAIYLFGILLSIIRLLVPFGPGAVAWTEAIIWYSGVPTSFGLLLCLIDLIFMLGRKRKCPRWVEGNEGGEFKTSPVTVVLTAYNDEDGIADAVTDFRGNPLVKRVIVVSNNSSDQTMERAAEAGAIVYNEPNPGYGQCVYRCFSEVLNCPDAEIIVLCEGDCTFRARDLDKFLAYLPHAEIVNGTRIVEQLRAYDTQLNTFMYYGNFFVGKLLEVKHLGRGTFTDVGTTYKVMRRDALERLLPYLNPAINLEFNAHFMDTALRIGTIMVECPITFHPRVGVSKGGNVNTRRAMSVGLRMMKGILLGWPGDVQ